MTAWLTFAGFALVVAILYWAQAVLMPIVLAVLITFVLAKPVTLLQRLIGRVPAVLISVAIVFSLLGIALWGFASQMSQLAEELPSYRANIRQKIADIRRAGRGGSMEKVQQTIDEIRIEIDKTQLAGAKAGPPMLVRPEPATSAWGFPAWLAPVWGPLSTGGLVVVLVIFMLLEREQLRWRVIGLIGHGNLAVTTRAFDEAGEGVSRQLLMQTLVNVIYGALVGTGLYLLDAPYPLLFAALGAALRYIPYLGPALAAGLPILVTLAAEPGWMKPVWVAGLFFVLELFTNLVLEVVLYAGAAAISQVALLVAVAFWTWLWGPMGLLLATPLTVCVVVLARHVAGLEFLSRLMADTPALAADVGYYQRLLARDEGEAADLIEQHIEAKPPDSVYDELMLPAVCYAERDRLEDRLSANQEAVVVDLTRELIDDAAVLNRAARARAASDAGALPRVSAPPGEPLTVAAFPATGAADELALRMLGRLLDDDGIALDMEPAHLMSSEMIAAIRDGRHRVVCIADLPPSSASKTRYVVKKLRAAFPELHIIVGRWAPAPLVDDTAALTQAGASYVGTTLIETRDHLRELTHLADAPKSRRREMPAATSVGS